MAGATLHGDISAGPADPGAAYGTISSARCGWCRRYPLAVSDAGRRAVLGSVAGLWYLSSLSRFSSVRQTALESARLETKMLDEVWRFYSEEISDIDPKISNVTITENYKTVHPALPLPATFAIDLGERISRRSPGTEVRVYSRYPMAHAARMADRRTNSTWPQSSGWNSRQNHSMIRRPSTHFRSGAALADPLAQVDPQTWPARGAWGAHCGSSR